MDFRIGQGIDVHPFIKGRPLVLGGVTIPFDKGLDGHSDADALTHALIDALLGAAGKGDIGSYFPNTSEQWKNAVSLNLLEIAWRELAAEGWRVGNIDCTLLAEAPKLLSHMGQMKENLASVLCIEVGQIGIKATTTEQLGFVGRGEGVMAFAVALLIRD